VTQEPTSHKSDDPCLQIQVDLSAMLDGELEPASVRRVMVHSDVCASCRGFLRAIRSQAQLHRTMDEVERSPEGGDVAPAAAAALRWALTDNRKQLSRILYELGRGFVLMGLSPDFSREVAKEPVPVPDMALRGRHLVEEMSRAAQSQDGVAADWVAAKELFETGPRSTQEHFAKGQRLLSECLALEPDHHAARIYLGLVHHVRGQRLMARGQFSAVLDASDDVEMRAFALLNLGNVCLEEGECERAIGLLEQVVDSGVIARHPRFGMAYFNLALAFGLMRRFDQSHFWFDRLHRELPHKQRAIARELDRRSQFRHLLRSDPEAQKLMSQSFPFWFEGRAEAG
jgi:tetratricopeptide (TPR) repeat protein